MAKEKGRMTRPFLVKWVTGSVGLAAQESRNFNIVPGCIRAGQIVEIGVLLAGANGHAFIDAF